GDVAGEHHRLGGIEPEVAVDARHIAIGGVIAGDGAGTVNLDAGLVGIDGAPGDHRAVAPCGDAGVGGVVNGAAADQRVSACRVNAIRLIISADAVDGKAVGHFS